MTQKTSWHFGICTIAGIYFASLFSFMEAKRMQNPNGTFWSLPSSPVLVKAPWHQPTSLQPTWNIWLTQLEWTACLSCQHPPPLWAPQGWLP